jgi:Heterokaryon incompatibility protein (HET)
VASVPFELGSTCVSSGSTLLMSRCRTCLPFYAFPQVPVCTASNFRDISLFHCRTDNPAAPFVRDRPVNTDSASVGCFDLAKHWIRTCLEQHPLCPRDSNNILPTRVIDVGTSENSQNPFLFITQGQCGQWVTLSHCWGSATPAMTTTETLSAHCRHIIPRDLPPLYRDAVEITRRLRYRYLWIDSLCILQDSIPDWRSESAEMGAIYRNAVLNISADASPDPDCGIFESANSKRGPAVPLLSLACRSSTGQTEGSVDIHSMLKRTQNENPLHERAWVVQENMFSPRKLHYEADEIWWSCETTRYCCESDPDMNRIISTDKGPHSIFQMPLLSQFGVKPAEEDVEKVSSTVLSLWYRKIVDYAARQITYNSDRFPAIAGLAKEVAAHTGYQYKAGLWLEDVHAGLLWNAPRVGVDARHAPTWSWAVIDNRRLKLEKYGVNGVVSRRLVRKDKFRANIVEIYVRNVNDDPFGQVESAYITTEGRWRSVEWREKPTPVCDCWNDRRYLLDRHRRIDRLPEEKLTAPSQTVCSLDEAVIVNDFMADMARRRVIYMQVGRSVDAGARWGDAYERFALVLEPTGRVDNEYRRIGTAQIPEDDGMADGWEKKTVTVI